MSRYSGLSAHVQAVQARTDAVEEKLAALLSLLEDKGLLCQDALQVRLHRRRFAAVRKAHPCSCTASFAEVLAVDELARGVLTHAGFNTLRALGAACSSLSEEALSVSRSAEALFPQTVYVFGGWDGGALNSAERLRPNCIWEQRLRPDWEPLPAMKHRRIDAAAVTAGNAAYVCGGRDGDVETLRSVERFDPEVRTWQDMPPLHTQRYGAVAGRLQSQLVVVGGCDGALHLSSAERLATDSDAWVPITPMDEPRLGAAGAVLQGRLVVCGGQGFNGEVLSSVVALEPQCSPQPMTRSDLQLSTSSPSSRPAGPGHDLLIRATRLTQSVSRMQPARGSQASNIAQASLAAPLAVGNHGSLLFSWVKLPDLTMPRHGASAGSISGRIIVCGGHGGMGPGTTMILDSVETYDPTNRTWQALPQMRQRRVGAATAVLAGRLLVLGGHNGVRSSSSAERCGPMFCSIEGRDFFKGLPTMGTARYRAVAAVLRE